jgi:hypothetical protein
VSEQEVIMFDKKLSWYAATGVILFAAVSLSIFIDMVTNP